ncbi:unnamed protein product [Clonostachys rhizophaga]|uniref:DUF4484 domain-containing protein n=1 Tax=Clonostachys rhizophaga TaxID=160324 RepID=A0A9N9YVL1_9HYPO|nr:unnamed protein product [Clonostachys rhizophaga]
MASLRRGGRPSLSFTMPNSTSNSNSNVTLPERPPIDALFLIDFDVKKGYTIVWKRTADGIDVDGRVEYKSLPSGLHTVTDDLIYFVHDGAHAGLSAFINTPCDEEDARNARMIAVGVLVPLSFGRLGRAWRHAQGLKDLAAKLVKDRSQTSLLQAYWDDNKASKDTPPQASFGETPLSTPAVVAFSEPADRDQPKRKGHNRNRSASDGASLAPPEHKLSPFHPAWSLTSLLDKFGPLIFPIYRAALLRQRILISCHAPVHEICDYVYNLSVLSNIPLSLFNILPENPQTQRLRPLFTIGVHDIPFLTEDYEAAKRREQGDLVIDDDEAGSGWIACTTDSILAMKDTLWDMLITIPPDHTTNSKESPWPVVECPRGIPIKATQRDLRRFNALRAGLARLVPSGPAPDSPVSDHARRPSTSYSIKQNADDSFEQLVEPLTWSAFAYNGYMWWASAGEQLRSEEQEESARDAALLADLEHPSAQNSMSMPGPGSRADPLADSISSLAARRNAADPEGEARIELAVVTYFHRLTAQMLSILSDIVEGVDGAYPLDESDGEEEGDALLSGQSTPRAITIDNRAVDNMGLDVWSASDAAFVQGLVRTYFDRTAKIEGKGIEVCGVRVC